MPKVIWLAMRPISSFVDSDSDSGADGEGVLGAEMQRLHVMENQASRSRNAVSTLGWKLNRMVVMPRAGVRVYVRDSGEKLDVLIMLRGWRSTDTGQLG